MEAVSNVKRCVRDTSVLPVSGSLNRKRLVRCVHHLLRKCWQAVHALCRPDRADLHESPVQACERPVSLSRLRANHA
jgi:hypothetical protein